MTTAKKRSFSTLTSVNDDGADIVNRPSKRTKSRKNKKAAAAAAAAAEANSHNLSSLEDDDVEFVTISDHNRLKKQFSDLSAELQTQKKIVADLKTQLSSLMSLVDINNSSTAGANQTSSAINSFAAAVKHPAAAVVAADRSVQETVIAAVYVDNQRRLNRATNLVITGLAASTVLSDQQAVVELCSSEFNEVPEIVYSKRLGKPLAGRVQPLLVILKSVDQATRLLSIAKSLRQSANEQTRRDVYISANLTKAEARAAYEMRCERRRTAERRTSQPQQRNQPQNQPQSQPVVQTQQQPHLTGQTQQQFQQSSSPHNIMSAAPLTVIPDSGRRTLNGSINNFLPSPGGHLLVMDTAALPQHRPTVVSPPVYLSLPPGPQQPTQWHIDQQNQHHQQQLQAQQSWQQQNPVGSQHSDVIAQPTQNTWQQQAWFQAPPRQSTSAPVPLTQQQPC